MPSRSYLRLVGAVVLAPIYAMPQALTEHAAALAGSSVGTAAGKGVSDGLTKIFGAVDATAAKSADSEQPAKKPSESPATTSGAPASSGAVASSEPVPAGSIHSATASASRVQQQPEPVASVPSEVPVLPESQPKQPTLELLAAVKIGVKEDELASLGPAASRVTIPDEGHLREILTYSVNGQRLGTIRLDNGEVVSVQPAVSKDVTP